MNVRAVAKALGVLLAFLAAAGAAPLAADAVHDRPTWPWLVMVLTALTGSLGLFAWGRRDQRGLGLREGMAVTTLAWLTYSLVGGLGICLASPAGFVEGWFEAMSGFTTTGASIFGDAGFATVASLTPGVKLWRAVMQGIGGIGIVVMSLALLPLIGSGGSGFQLYRAEVSGVDKGRLEPRIRDTARVLLRAYLGLCVLAITALWCCPGVSGFDAVCHALPAISTGGFATYDDSVEGLRSHAAEWVLIAGMLAGGLNFALIIAVLRGRVDRLWHSVEVRVYLGLVAGCGLAIALLLAAQGRFYVGDLHGLVRDSLFQVVSIMTTTGFCSGYDSTAAAGGLGYDVWPQGARLILLALMVTGACAGSTAGGVKLVRLIVAWKAARRELRRALEPARVTPVSIDGSPLRDPVVLQVAAFLGLYALTWILGTLLLTLVTPGTISLETAASAALASLGNVGPGLAEVGPACNFRHLGGAGQTVCLLLMLLGRLELFAALLALRPKNWQR